MYTNSYLGKTKRLNKIFNNEKVLIAPVDDSLLFGPYNGLYDLKDTIEKIKTTNPNAILGFKGAYQYTIKTNIPFIYNITASTVLGAHTKKMKIANIEDIVAMGVECVAVHINFSSIYENKMLECLATTTNECDKFGIPVMAIAYPRKEIDGKDYNYEDLKEKSIEEYTNLICHCVRVAAELGADIIKTQYTGSQKSFKKVIESALGKPVVIAGGKEISVEESYKMAYDAMKAGASGLSYGRNVFNSKNIIPYINGLKSIIFDNTNVETALKIYKDIK